MTTTLISAEAARTRDIHREPTGKFGVQPHVETESFSWDNGQRVSVANEWAEVDAYAAQCTPVTGDPDDGCRTTVVTGKLEDLILAKTGMTGEVAIVRTGAEVIGSEDPDERDVDVDVWVGNRKVWNFTYIDESFERSDTVQDLRVPVSVLLEWVDA